jgi:hypothetical protein
VSNYTQSTNFATKDSLPSGDPLKIVKGTEINTEFVNIAVAIATKADLASPTFTGTPAAPTASSGTNTTQLATTAFVTAAVTASLAAVYPVGSIYINAGVSTNPATLLGFGTWTAFGAGRVMVGLNASDALFDTLEETGGSKDAIVVSHTHTATSTVTDPQHQHAASSGNFLTETGSGSYAYGGTGANISVVTNTANASTGVTVATTNSTEGSSGTNANLQPYITVAMWKRTA